MKTLKKRIFSLLLSMATAATVLSSTMVDASAYSDDVSGLTATEICQKMGVGWNLGNTLDATNAYNLDSETSWGNPKTTKAMIDAVKNKGFTCVRIPVSWFNHMDSSYNVDSAWLARVKEVVNYCIDDGLYVILNSHHDQWNKPVDYNYSAASNELKTLWTQIANYFSSYDRHLVFEGMNEPRNYGGEHEWDGGTSEMHEVVNKLNADFVSAVRATGGKNSTRCLMIPTYAASSEYAAMADLKIPDDKNIIVSIHAYAPWNFAYNVDSGAVYEFNKDMESELNSMFKNFSNLFVSNGIPVCIGEFSATNKNNFDERVKWGAYYAKKAKELGISCVLWDNNYYETTDGSLSNETHGHLNRSNLTWYDEAVVDSIINSYKNTPTKIPGRIVVPDLSKAECTVLSDKVLTGEGYTPTDPVQFDFTKMKDGDFIAVEYSGASNPKLVLQDNKEYLVWCEVSPYTTDKGVAYYSYSDLCEAYSAKYQSAYGSAPASPLAQAFQCFVTGAGSNVTVTKVIYADFKGGVTPPTPQGKSLSDCSVYISSDRFDYTGSEIKPYVTVKDGDTVLKEDVDYTVSYSNNVNPGTATVTVSGKGNYNGSVKKSFIIVSGSTSAPDLSKAKCTVLSDKVLKGEGWTPTDAIPFDFSKMKANDIIAVDFYGSQNPKFVLQDNNEYKVWAEVSPFLISNGTAYFSYADMAALYSSQYENAYGVKLSNPLDRAFQGFVTGCGEDITVTKVVYADFNNSPVEDTKNISNCSITLSFTRYEFTGNAARPKVTVKSGDKVLVAGTDYVVRYSENVEVGTAYVIISGKGNYTGTVEKTFEIVESSNKDIAKCNITLNKTMFKSTGKAIKPRVIVKDGSKTLTSGTDYVVRYVDNVNPGTASVIIAGKGNYTGKVTKTFKILNANAKNISSCKVTLNKSTFSYTGRAVKPSVIVKDGSTVLKATVDYNVRYVNNVNKGTGTVVISGTGNYQGVINKTFTIK